MNVICAHEEMDAYHQQTGPPLRYCTDCGLPEGTPVVSCTNPGEIEEWWHHTEANFKREKADRVGINRVAADRTLLTNKRNEIQTLLTLEEAFADDQKAIERTRRRLEEVLAELMVFWP